MNAFSHVRELIGLRGPTSAARFRLVSLAALAAPIGLWCATVAFAPVAHADDEGKPSAEAKEEGQKDKDKVSPEARRDGDEKSRDRERPRGETPRRDGDRPRDNDRPRDGEGPPRVGPRDGEGPRRAGPRDGDRPGPREPRDGDRLGIDGPDGEIIRMLRELRMEVQALRREVNELREGRGGGVRREGERERPRPAGDRDRPRPEDRERPRPEGDRR